MKLPRHPTALTFLVVIACDGSGLSIGRTGGTPYEGVSATERAEAVAAAERWSALSTGEMDAGSTDDGTSDGGVFVPGAASNVSPPGVLEARIDVSWVDEEGVQFGDVAISGDTLVVGAVSESEDSPGAAYVFTRSNRTWELRQVLRPSAGEGAFGASVAISGDTIVVGSSLLVPASQGSVYVFQLEEQEWRVQARLTDKTKGVSTGDPTWALGRSVAVSGDTIIAATVLSESAYLYGRHDNEWTLQAVLVDELPETDSLLSSTDFGTAVGVSHGTVIVGAPTWNYGAAQLFTRNAARWSVQTHLAPSLNADSLERDFVNFGQSVSISGNTALIGAPYQRETHYQPGTAYLFERTGETWQLAEKLTPDPIAPGLFYPNGNFGREVCISGDIATVSATAGYDDGSRTPRVASVYVYVRVDGRWSKSAALFPEEGRGDPGLFSGFGQSVSISGSTIAVAESYPDKPGTSAVYVFSP